MFKFFPLGQDASICLRCQYRFITRTGGRRRNAQQVARDGLQVRRLGNGSSHGQEPAFLAEAEIYDGNLYPPITKYDPGNLPLQYVKSRRLKPQLKDSLGVDVLGEPAEVLVLRQTKEQDRDRADIIWDGEPGFQNDASTEAPSSSEMLKAMKKEKGLVNDEQVFDNIENIKSSWMRRTNDTSGTLSDTEYTELSMQLHDGFTIKQLDNYFESTGGAEVSDPFNLTIPYIGTMFSRSAWAPGITPLDKIKAPFTSLRAATQPTSTKRETQKPSVVEKILRERWNMRIEQNEASEGELNIRLRDIDHKLIMKSKRNILKQLSESYSARIEAVPQARILRVTADCETCLDVFKVVVKTLEQIGSMVFDDFEIREDMLPSESFAGQEMLRQAEQLTNTVIMTKKVDSGRKREIRIFYLERDETDLQDVRRLIGQTLKPTTTAARQILWGSSMGSLETSPVPVDVGSGLSLADTHIQWARWASPSERPAETEKQAEPSPKQGDTFEGPLNYRMIAVRALGNFFAAPQEEYEEALLHWSPTTRHQDSATFGRVLFPMAVAKKAHSIVSVMETPGKSRKLEERLRDSRREFVTMVPGTVRSLEHLGLETLALTLDSEEYLDIQLTPSLKSQIQGLPSESLPDLEIRMAVNKASQATSIRFVRLIRRRMFDLLLPSNTMDLRFVRRNCIYADPKSIDPRIADFIQNSNLDVAGTERLKTPTNLTINIPSHTLRSDQTFKKPDTGILPSIRVDYTFSSLAHRSKLSMPFRQAGSWSTITYNTTEAGRIGGRSSSLSLSHLEGRPDDASPATPKSSTADEQDAQSVPPTERGDRNTTPLLRKANALLNMIESLPPLTKSGTNVGMAEDFQARAFRFTSDKGRQKATRDLLSGLKSIEDGNTPKTPDGDLIVKKVITKPVLGRKWDPANEAREGWSEAGWLERGGREGWRERREKGLRKMEERALERERGRMDREMERERTRQLQEVEAMGAEGRRERWERNMRIAMSKNEKRLQGIGEGVVNEDRDRDRDVV